jgi:hypothetical protein
MHHRPCAMTTIRMLLLSMTAAALVLTGCAGGSPASDAPSPSPSPSPSSTLVTTPAQAVARVTLAEPRLAGIAARDPNLIGQASWYEVAPASGVGAFVVAVRIGWGDCEAGCIDEHRWNYAVSPDGAISIVSQTGAAVPDTAWPDTVAARRTGVSGTATAGPVCPVETVPPDPGCAARPVAGAVLLVRDGSGQEVARATAGADGTFFVALRPGGYVVEPQAVEGLMGTASSQSIVVTDGAATVIQVDYDTGIR